MDGGNVFMEKGVMLCDALHHHVLCVLGVGYEEVHGGHCDKAAVLLLVHCLPRHDVSHLRADNPGHLRRRHTRGGLAADLYTGLGLGDRRALDGEVNGAN